MVHNQAFSFIAYFFSGIIICIVFDLFRSLRMGIKTSNTATYIEDIIFGIIAGLVIFFVINKYNYGELRIYAFVGMLLGGIFYFFTISKYCIKYLVYIILTLKKMFSFLINYFLKFIGKPIYFFIIDMRKNIKKNEKNKRI